MPNIKIFHGNATPKLAADIANHLEIPLGKAKVDYFSDGETYVEILENVRGRQAYIIQSTCAPANQNVMELAIMADALRRACIESITAIIPYYGYARQDRRVRSARVPISAKVVADTLSIVGITQVITVDLHADQIQGFFDMPVDNVYATPTFLEDLRKKRFANPLVVSPDVGGVIRARAVAKRLNDSDLAIIDKRRPEPNKTQVMNVIGDVKGRDCIIIDDIIDTGGTLCQGAETLKEHGATTVTAYVTHPVLSGQAVQRITDSVLDELVVTDTIPLSKEAMQCSKIRQLSLAPMLAEAILRDHKKESISSMFLD